MPPSIMSYDVSLGRLLASSSLRGCMPAVAEPVPLQHAASLSDELGRQVFVKREDRVDDFGCGNKLRKLHYIAEDALARGVDTFISVGSLPSNQCKAVAKVARQRGLRAHLVYGGDIQRRPAVARGSYLLTSLFNPSLTWFENTPWHELGSKLQGVYEAEVQAGFAPLVIPSGASAWPGIVGSLELAMETASQLRAFGLEKADIVCAAGSGGTAAGFQLAAELFDLDHEVHGICIGEPSSGVAAQVQALVEDAFCSLNSTRSVARPARFHDVALGVYDRPTDAELEIMARGATRHGLLLDPNYMVKAFIGLEHLSRHDLLRAGATIVLIHTGGQSGLFDGNPNMASWHARTFPNWLSEDN